MGAAASADDISKTITESSDKDLADAASKLSAANCEKLKTVLGEAEFAKTMEKERARRRKVKVTEQEDPDYTKIENWYSHPAIEGCHANNVIPEGEEAPPPVAERKCAVFYICGSAYTANLIDKDGGPGANCDDPPEPWNCPVPDGPSDEWNFLEAAQCASALNIAGQLYIPRYRQAGMANHNHFLRASATEEEKKWGYDSMDVAYNDVKRAFFEFIKQTKDMPIVLAGHSQGIIHGSKLLMEVEKDKEILKRLVAAYMLGHIGCLPLDTFERKCPSLHPCNGPEDFQCVIACDSPGNGTIENWTKNGMYSPEEGDAGIRENCCLRRKSSTPPHAVSYPEGWEAATNKPMLVTNLITWTSEKGRTDKSLFLGGVEAVLEPAVGTWKLNMQRKSSGVKVVRLKKIDVGQVWTEVMEYEGGLLQGVDEGKRCEWHDEWANFYFNIRANFPVRVEAFLKAQSK